MPQHVAVQDCETRHERLKTLGKVVIGLLGVLVTCMGVFVVMAYNSWAASTGAQQRATDAEGAIKIEVETSRAWRESIQGQLSRIDHKLDSIESHLRDGKRP